MRAPIMAALLAMLTAVPATAQTCPPFVAQSPSTFPTTVLGRMVYQRHYLDTTRPQGDQDASNIYIFDFANRTQPALKIDTVGWGLRFPLNPVFSRDGKGVLFSAVRAFNGGEVRDLFYWTIGSPNPATNLTAADDGGDGTLQRDEDPKFSRKGEKIVWKRNGGLAIGDFSVDNSGVPHLDNRARLLSGTIGASIEKSGPVLSPTEKYVYFFLGSNTDTLHLYSYNLVTKVKTPIKTPSTFQAYYPVDPDLYGLIYVSQLDASHPADKIYFMNLMTQKSYVWNGADCDADNSDPASIDEDYILYSRNPGTSSLFYRLFVGSVATGQVWDISSLAGASLFDGADGDLLGGDYTDARP